MRNKIILFTIVILIVLSSAFLIFTRPAIAPTIKEINVSSLKDSDNLKMHIVGTDKTLNLEVAASSQKHTQGLMFRTSMPENDGMIFIFEKSQPRSFWMQNTLISLDIIYLDENFKVIKIYQNTKTNQTTEIYPSNEPSKYVLETNAGWSFRSNLKIGDIFEIQ